MSNLELLREIIGQAWQEGRVFVSSLPPVHDVPMNGWDGALQLQIVRHV